MNVHVKHYQPERVKISKRKKETPTHDVGPSSVGRVYVPLNERKYPQSINGGRYLYERFFVRPNFIVYEIYTHARDIVGFLVVWPGGEKRIMDLPYWYLWKDMEKLTDQLEARTMLQVIAK